MPGVAILSVRLLGTTILSLKVLSLAAHTLEDTMCTIQYCIVLQEVFYIEIGPKLSCKFGNWARGPNYTLQLYCTSVHVLLHFYHAIS